MENDCLAIVNGLCFMEGEFFKANVLIKDGFIEKITKEDVKCSKEEKLDAKGCLVIPAFFNSHTHAAMTLLRCIAEDLSLMNWLKVIWSIEGKMREKDVYIGTKLSIIEMIKSGIACFSDMYFHMDEVAKAVKESGIRAILGYGMIDMGDEEKRRKEIKETKKFIEKWINDDKIGLSIDPHSVYTCSEELLLESVKLSEIYNLPLHIHLAETKEEVKEVKEKTGKTPAKYLNDIGFFKRRVIAAHCVWLSEDEMMLLSNKEVSVAHCPVSNLKLGSGIANVIEMLKRKINVCLGTDGAASNNSLNILQEMKLAALLQKVSKGVNSIRALDVFKMATENGYRAYGLKGGKIKENYLADLVILKKVVNYTPLYNPLYSIVYSSYGCEVRDLIVGGKILMKDKKLTTLDEERVVEEAEKRGAELQKC